MIKSVIFDFDGVLLESAEIKTEAFRQLFSGYPDKVDEIVKYHEMNMGISRYVKFHYFYEKILGKELSRDKETELGEKFSQIVMKKIESAPFVPGTLDFLNAHYKKTPFFVASGTPHEELYDIIKKRGIPHYFKEIHGTPRKKPEIIIDILSRYSWSTSDVIFVGDAESDLKAAEESGVCFIARISPLSDNRLSGCPFRINSMRELEKTIDKIMLSKESHGNQLSRINPQRKT
ncbi:MAG: HAD family hydrolase [Dissulfuribacterales bacterium]